MPTTRKPQTTCPLCHGKGRVPDTKALSARLRAMRERAGLSLRDVAGAMKEMSPGYLSDMERGDRQFSAEHEQEFRDVVKKLARDKRREKKPSQTTKPKNEPASD